MQDEVAKPFMTFEELRLEDISAVWHGMDLDTMGRVLRAHLVVEHFMDESLAAEGIDLPRLKKGGIWIRFSNKQRLLGKRGAMSVLSEGINQLNEIRNAFAHNPAHQLTVEQTCQFYDAGGHFKTYLTAYCRAHALNELTPIQVVEAFAESASALLLVTTRAMVKADAQIKVLEQKRLTLEAHAELLATLDADEEEAEPSTQT